MNTIKKIVLLSISFLLTTAYAITPGIPQMLKEFPNYTEAQIQLLVTIPALSVMIIVFFNDQVTKLLGKKLTLQIGLILISLFGPLPIFLTQYSTILISRIILGVGLSLITPLGVSLISYFFSGPEKATMMGMRSASESIGQSLLTLASGYLITNIGWNYSFLVYTIAIPILILATIYIPEIDEKDKKRQIKIPVRDKLNKDIIFYFLALFIVVGSYVGIRVRIPLIIKQRAIGTEIESSQILSMIPFIGLIIGVIFGRIYKLFKRHILMIGSLCMVIGYVIIGMASSYWLFFLGGLFVGIGYPIIISGTFTLVSSFSTKKSENFVTSTILSGINLGAFLAPYLLQWIDQWTGDKNLITPFYIYAGLLMIFGIISSIKNKEIKN